MSLVRADAVQIPLRDESVDLIVTSPPYFALRSYQDDGEHYGGQIGSEDTPQAFLEALWAVTAECRRVLKPSGSMWVNLGDKYSGNATGGPLTPSGSTLASPNKDVATNRARTPYVDTFRPKSLMGLPWRYAIGCIDQLDLILRAEVIWSKPNGLPESVTDRVRRSHEQWFMFTKSPRYFAAVDEIREPQKMTGTRAPGTKGVADGDEGYAGGAWSGMDEFFYNPLGKLPGSVWTVPSEPLKVPEHIGVDHFAAFPQEWPRRIILGWSPNGICTRCGEGRAPVVDKELALGDDGRTCKRCNKDHGRSRLGSEHMAAAVADQFACTEATITGYACACPDTTAPTRPAVVLDPFAGTGTTVMVARALGRYGVGLDLSADYLRLARWRVYESGHAQKSVSRMWRERQGSMFEGVA